MKQTTIRIAVEESIIGATIFPASRWGRSYDYSPNEWEMKAWQLIAGEGHPWGIGRAVEPKEGESLDDWWKAFSDRLERVCGNRAFKSKVKVLSRFPQGSVKELQVTFYWNKPKDPPNKETPGRWILREYKGTSRRGKILADIPATLECWGDDLYKYLPYEAHNYEVLPDIGDIIIQQNYSEKVENPAWYRFTFKKSRKLQAVILTNN